MCEFTSVLIALKKPFIQCTLVSKAVYKKGGYLVLVFMLGACFHNIS